MADVCRVNFPQMHVNGSYWWEVNIGLGNDLVPSGNKPLPESIWLWAMLPYDVTRPQSVKAGPMVLSRNFNDVKELTKVYFMIMTCRLLPEDWQLSLSLNTNH